MYRTSSRRNKRVAARVVILVFAIISVTGLVSDSRTAGSVSGVGPIVSAPQLRSDLIIQSFSISPTSGPAGSGVTVNLTIRNQGSGAANTSTTNIRLAASSSAVTTSDPLLASISTPGIAAGVTHTISRSVNIPGGTPAGTRHVWVILDVDSTANQSNESNDKASRSFTVTVPPFVITSVSPNPLTGSNSAQTLTVNGSGFVSGAQVRLRCSAFDVDATKSATFVSSTQLRVSATFGNDPAAWTAQVINPGGTASGQFNFTVQAPVPSIQSLSPSSASAGGGAFTLRVSGNTFHQSSIVRWNGASRTTRAVVSSGGLTTALDAQISSSDIAAPGTASVTVNNPGPGGGTSAAVAFILNGVAQPTITSVSPSSYPASSSNQSMTINGNNFRSGATLTFRDPRGTSIASTASKLTFVSSSRINYQFNNANDTGTWTVRVTNPDGQQSSAVSFTVTTVQPPPTITGVSPNPVTGSNSAQLFTINGTGFTPLSRVTLKDKSTGQEFPDRSIRSQTSTQIVINPIFTTDEHTWSVQVFNGSLASGEFTFRVTAPAGRAAPPTPVSPGSASPPGATVSDLTPRFTWEPVVGATGYGLYIRDMSAAGTPLIYPNSSGTTNTPLTGTSFVLQGGLISGHNYRWNMTSFVGASESTTASAPLYFKTAVSGGGSFLLSFPLEGQTPDTAVINSVFDHSMTVPYTENRVVTAYTGEQGEEQFGTTGGASPGYKNAKGTNFRVNGNYAGAGTRDHLNYDGHPGIDFRAASGTLVYATADGVVHYPDSIPGLSNAARYNTMAIDHGNGYVTYYLHCSTHPSAGNALFPEGAVIKRGDPAARSGDAGVPGAPHLHLEVHKQGVPVDPYGWNGTGSDPYTAARNTSLWQIGRAACQNPTEQEISDYADQLSLIYKVPSVIIKALVEQESIDWQHCGIMNTEPSGDVGIGLTQITVDPNAPSVLISLGEIHEDAAEGANPFRTMAQPVSVDIARLRNDWQYNLEVGVRRLVAKKVASHGEGDDATILENWYYPLAYYNGAVKYDPLHPGRPNNDPSDPRYNRSATSNDRWKDKAVFPYQECVFNIVAQLYAIPSRRRPFFGPPIKVTLPGPSAVGAGMGRYSFVHPSFCFFDWAQYSSDGIVRIGRWGEKDNGCIENAETRTGVLFHKVEFGPVTPPRTAPSAVVQLGAATFTDSEGAGATAITVTRSGDVTGAATVEFATVDDMSAVPCSTVNGTAYARCDYATTSRTLTFAAGETSKTITLPLMDDAYVEGTETTQLQLRNAVGAALGTQNTATAVIVDNDSTQPPGNPIDNADAQFFVRQQYFDFLNREPDAPGLQFWAGNVTACGSNAGCAEAARVNVSAAFFLSIEFQETGYLVYRTYKAAYGDATSPDVPGTVPVVRFEEFLPDTQKVGGGVQVGVGDWQRQLEENKSAFVLDFVRRPRFLSAYPSNMTPAEFVGKLNQQTGGVLSADEQMQLVNELAARNTDEGRASVLRKVAEDADLSRNELNRAFVLMQYYGYLRRNPDAVPDTNFGGWKFWLDKLEQFDGNFVNAEMVRAFISSIEYRRRFGQ